MVAGSFTKEVTSPVAVERLWKAAVIDRANLYPKIMPEVVASIDTVEGDGGVGSIRQFNFGPAVKDSKFIKDRLEALDDVNHILKYSILEGGPIGLRLKTCLYEFKIEAAAGDGGSVMTHKVEYDTLDDTPLTEEEKDGTTAGLIGAIKGAEGYLLANPTEYA